jgi:hypothetical protein
LPHVTLWNVVPHSDCVCERMSVDNLAAR